MGKGGGLWCGWEVGGVDVLNLILGALSIGTRERDGVIDVVSVLDRPPIRRMEPITLGDLTYTHFPLTHARDSLSSGLDATSL